MGQWGENKATESALQMTVVETLEGDVLFHQSPVQDGEERTQGLQSTENSLLDFFPFVNFAESQHHKAFKAPPLPKQTFSSW